MFRLSSALLLMFASTGLMASVSNISVIRISHSAALIQVDFTAPTEARVVYGPTPALGYASNWYSAPLTRHVIWATALNSSQLYYFRVQEGAGGNVTSNSQLQTFFTRGALTTEAIQPLQPRRYDTRVPAQTGNRRLVSGNCQHPDNGLQAQIDAAVPGDTIYILPGTTCKGPFALPAKPAGTAPDRMWITIRTALPDFLFIPDGYRVQPSDASLMPRILAPDKTNAAISARPGANHYRLIGLNIIPASSTGEFNGGFAIPDASVSDIILDRLLIQTFGTNRMKWAVVFNGSRLAVINSYIETVYPGYEWYPGEQYQANSYCMVMHGAPGPVRFTNNTCRSLGIGVFGTDDGAGTIEDIEISQNTFSYDDKYRRGSPTSDGIFYAHRCAIEFKKGRRILIEGNIFRDMFGDQLRNGQILVFTPRNGSSTAPVDDVNGITDLTISHNVFRDVPGGINIGGSNADGGYSSPVNTPLTERVRISNNLLFNIDGFKNIAVGSYYDSFRGSFLSLYGGGSDFTIENNSYVNPKGLGPGIIRAMGDALGRLNMRNNIVWLNTDWYEGGAVTYSESNTLPNMTPRKDASELDVKYTLDGWAAGGQANGYRYVRNVMPVGDGSRLNSEYWASHIPADNFLPGDGFTGLQNVSFVDQASDNYRLSSLSKYKNAGTDSRDPGVDMDTLDAKIGSVRKPQVSGKLVQYAVQSGNQCVLTYRNGSGLATLVSYMSGSTGVDGYMKYNIDVTAALSAGVRAGDLRCRQTITAVRW